MFDGVQMQLVLGKIIVGCTSVHVPFLKQINIFMCNNNCFCFFRLEPILKARDNNEFYN